MERLIGWIVKALEVNGKLKIVSGPLQTKDGAETFRALYEKQNPGSSPIVEQRVLDDRN